MNKTHSKAYMTPQIIIEGTYRGAHLAWKVWAPMALPMQYAINMTAPVTDFLVLPATLDGSKVQIKRPGKRPVTVMR
jgi:hypothetical protein